MQRKAAMATELEAAQAARAAAEAAAAAAQRASDAAEITFLDGIRNVKQISDGRTQREADRLKSRYISVFGLQRWTALVRDSR